MKASSRLKGFAVNAALSAVMVLLVLLACEVALRLFVPLRDVGTSVSTYHPVYGTTLKKSFRTTRTSPEFTFQLSTNAHGFRGPESSASAARPILFLGDSFTMGYGVSDGEEFPALVRSALDRRLGPGRVSVVNAGVGNTGPGRWIKFLRSQGDRLDPRLIVLQLFENDYGDNVREGFFELSASGELLERPVPPPSRGRRIQQLVESIPGLTDSHLFGLARQAKLGFSSRASAESPEAADTASAAYREERRAEEALLLRIVEETLNLARASGWPVLVLSVGIEGERLANLKRVLDRYGVLVEVVPGQAERPDLYFKVDGHWNETGHVFAAERVLGALREPALTDR